MMCLSSCSQIGAQRRVPARDHVVGGENQLLGEADRKSRGHVCDHAVVGNTYLLRPG